MVASVLDEYGYRNDDGRDGGYGRDNLQNDQLPKRPAVVIGFSRSGTNTCLPSTVTLQPHESD